MSPFSAPKATTIQTLCMCTYLLALDGCQGATGGVDQLGVCGGETAIYGGHGFRGVGSLERHLLGMLSNRLGGEKERLDNCNQRVTSDYIP